MWKFAKTMIKHAKDDEGFFGVGDEKRSSGDSWFPLCAPCVWNSFNISYIAIGTRDKSGNKNIVNIEKLD